MEDLKKVRALLGGRKALGGEVRTSLELVEHVREGLPPKTFTSLASKLDFTEEELAKALGIPRRTLTRRKREERLDRRESEAVVRLARIAGRASDALGDLAAAHRWLRTPNRSLGGRTPLSLVDTDLGATLVMDVLDRIEHGVYA